MNGSIGEGRMAKAPRLIVPTFGVFYWVLAPFTELAVRVIAGASLIAHG